MDPNAPNSPPLAYSPYETTPQDYAAVLAQLRRPPIRTPGALATNLMAEALQRYAELHPKPGPAGPKLAPSAPGMGSDSLDPTAPGPGR